MRFRAIAAAAVIVVAGVVAGLVLGGALSGGDKASGDRPAGPKLSALPAATGGSTDFSPEAVQAKPPKGTSRIATATRGSIRVYREPDAGSPRTLRRRTFEGRKLPLVFLVERKQGAWLRVHLPTRPNLSTGWVRSRDVSLAVTGYRIRVQLNRHRLTLMSGTRVVMHAPIAKGRAVSPTPTGRYYVTDLIKPPDPEGFYGPYALGLSAHSPVYTSFAGGDGQVGLHGTNQPSALGTDVSHGCIRVANRVILKLARQVPLGTPVDIA